MMCLSAEEVYDCVAKPPRSTLQIQRYSQGRRDGQGHRFKFPQSEIKYQGRAPDGADQAGKWMSGILALMVESTGSKTQWPVGKG